MTEKLDFLSRFDEPVALDGGRSWTAVVESYDERGDDAYYIVTIEGPGVPARHVMAQVFLGAFGDLRAPGFRDWLQGGLGKVAGSGKSNTDYKGSMEAWMSGGGRYPVE